MAYHGEPTAMDEKRKRGPVKQVVVDLLDDGMYTLCGYDEHHCEASPPRRVSDLLQRRYAQERG